MSVYVTMRIFSPRANPSWQLTPEQERAFTAWYEKASQSEKRFVDGGGTLPLQKQPPVGYRGFDVSIDGGRPVRLAPGDFLGFLGSPDGAGDAIDQWLFRTNAGTLGDRFGLDVGVTRLRARRIRGLPTSCSTAQLTCGNVPFPGHGTFWDLENGDPQHPELGTSLTNTCYNYAVDVPSRHTRMPTLNGRDPTEWSAREVRTGLEQDQLRFAGCELPNACPSDPTGTYIASCIHVTGPHDVKGDLHFLRLDRDGVWSQKFDTDPISNIDDAAPRRPMRDLCTAELTIGLLFVGFFEVTDRTRRHLRQHGSPFFGPRVGNLRDIRVGDG